ncbi:hypothetical protein R3Q06_23145 [Rhodococcus erythropolis]|uniref:hypothetical protein n=1 Tax=Rhodococcus erythropolis TaxID=1833 RepID=UPI00294A486B|nr:hypothetical protein [Rhodococcus erythropolis]MDV6276399.1 hypothetical protein [Rhodococcus erythropolis]
MTIIEATPQQLADAGAILGRSALFDNRFGEGDIGRASVWAEALAPYKLELPDALNAVTMHYRNEPSRMIMPADVIRIAREIRVDRAQREPAEDRELRQLQHDVKNGLVRGDAQLGGLPIGGADGKPVPDAYAVNKAIEHVCPLCGADEYQACTNKISGVERKMPCLPRLKIEAEPNPKYAK